MRTPDPELSPPYDRYASVYDELGQREFGERIAEATLEHLRAAGRQPKSVIDLACGTGAATAIFAASGLRVVGVDRSRAMLTEAERFLDRAGLRATWVEADLREVTLAEPADLVTCFYDSLNYLVTTEDLAAAFARARALVAPHGDFVFDLNTREKFAAGWSDACYVAVDRPDLFGLYRSWFEPETGTSPLRMTFFERTPDHGWERFDEEHIERAYPLDDVRGLLTAAGFVTEAMLDYRDRSAWFGPPGTEQSHRVVFIARPFPAARSAEVA